MDGRVLEAARILVVDDQEANVRLLETILTRGGYENVASTTDARRALPLFLEAQPDLVVLDLSMPHLDGFAVLGQLTPRIPAGTYLPILVITGETSTETKRRALSAGAKDFLRKPFDATEVLLRIRNLLETRLLHMELRDQNLALEARVRERTRELEQAQVEIAERLARAADYRDDVTGEHIRIPDQILLKPGRLTADEFERMKEHTVIGARLLAGSRSSLLQMAEEIALCHHERWDGEGYAGLAGQTIPLTARIVAVVDVFDALAHPRPYKPAWPAEEAAAEIERQRERHFDPDIVDAFLRVFERGAIAVAGTRPGLGESAGGLISA